MLGKATNIWGKSSKEIGCRNRLIVVYHFRIFEALKRLGRIIVHCAHILANVK